MTDYKRSECSKVTCYNGVRVTICPECKNHKQLTENEYYGQLRGLDCKNLIFNEDGTMSQCMCYSEEHR